MSLGPLDSQVVNKIGLATADRLAHEGAKVVISSRNEENVKRAIQDLIDSGINPANVAGTVCHVGNPQHRRHLLDFAIKKFGKVDVLFNNAGINPAVGGILDVTTSQFDKIYDVNVKATFLMSKIVAEHMKQNGGGVIIFNATFGAYQPLKGVRAYGLLKTALISITQALAHELGPFNIRVNTVGPGLIETRMGRVMFDPTNPRNKLVKIEEPIWCLKRLGQPEEIAAVVAYLASNDASFVTGESHLATGGAECRL
uniref:Dehydrogenase/reductase SDR family member 4 n=1 Tax=Bursaphelenchus xylophilus TaxID=6326 RepID=A0A1I7RMV9_BURXY